MLKFAFVTKLYGPQTSHKYQVLSMHTILAGR